MKEKKSSNIKKRKQLPYPQNLLATLNSNDCMDQSFDYLNISVDQMLGLEHALDMLNESEAEIVKLRYERCLTFVQIAEKLGKSNTRIGQIHAKALQKLCCPARAKWYIYGLEGCKNHMASQVANIKAAKPNKVDYYHMSIQEYGIPYGIAHKLNAAGIDTVADLIFTMKQPNWEQNIYGIGREYANQIVARLLKKNLIDKSYPAVKEYEEHQRIRKEVSERYINGDRKVIHRAYARREVDYPANLLEELGLNEIFGLDFDIHRLSQDQKDGVEAMLIATGELGCWTKGIKKAHIPVTPEILHWYYRDGLHLWQIAEKINRKDALREIRIWRSRIIRANIKYGIGMWAIKGASYKIRASDIQKWYERGENSLNPNIETQIAEHIQKMPEILTGTEWLNAGGLPEGYGKTETNSIDGICILWRKDNPNIRW